MMPAYVLDSAVAVARRSNAGPAFRAPDLTRSPCGRSTGRDSPGERGLVQHPVTEHQAIDRDHLAGLDEQAVTLRHLVDGPGDQLPVLVPGHDAGRALEQGRQLFVRPTVRVVFQRDSRSEHQRDHGAGEILAERERGDHRDQRDEIYPGLTADQTADHLLRHREDADDRRGGPDDLCAREARRSRIGPRRPPAPRSSRATIDGSDRTIAAEPGSARAA